MERVTAFGILSLPIIILSWRALFNVKSHGFYRFFSWECMLWLLVSNLSYWYDQPFSLRQIISWVFLFVSLYLVIAGVIQLKKGRKANQRGDDPTLFEFEKTSDLIDTGIYSLIRHPLYASLLFLTWGIFLKQTLTSLFIVSVAATILLILTALADEKECIASFGNKYRDYMRRTKRFIPFLF